MMYTNLWYAAELSDKIGEQPVKVRMLARKQNPDGWIFDKVPMLSADAKEPGQDFESVQVGAA